MNDSDALARQALKRWFGFDQFRPGQAEIVRDVMAGRDVLALMPTGGGKSLCFQLPALILDGLMLVVSPLIALMHDQVRLMREAGIPAAFLNSSLSGAEAAQIREDALSGKLKLLYMAPERLLSAECLERFLPQLRDQVGISAFTIDEAHCVSEWGHDFRPEYRQLSRLRDHMPGVPMLTFTATATERVRSDIVQQLRLQDVARHVSSFDRPNLRFAVRPKGRRAYPELLARARQGGSGIVYCLSRKRAGELAEQLHGDGIQALPYHAGLAADERSHHQDRFVRDDVQVMCATVAFGMGINKPDVRWVLHYDLPRTMEGYYQEAGRAGRDGLAAECTLMFGLGDIRTAEFLISKKVDPVSGEPLEDEQRVARQQLRQVLDYAESTECRRRIQLGYFGEEHPGNCGACDNCLEPKPTEDWTLEARQLLSCVARLQNRGESFGAAMVIDILRGSERQALIDRGLQQISTYGIGKARNPDQWRQVVRTLLHGGLLAQTQDGYPVLQLVPESFPLLRGETRFEMVPPPRKQPVSRAKGTDSAQLTTQDESLFEHLRALRKRLADERGVPPYMVFSDATLRQIAQEKPRHRDAFARISGVGARKLEEYGARFVGELNQYFNDDPL